MPKIAYIQKDFHDSTMATMSQADQIIREYMDQGYDLTLRQLYYQMVSRGYIPNQQKEYNRLGRIVSDGRMAGYIDWDAIVDRTRNLQRNSHWSSPESLLKSAASWYHTDLWENQDERVEVWIEKDALVGVIADVCERWDVPYFSCRGYSSMSEMWQAAQRIWSYIEEGQDVTIFHLSDHDPSGINMTEDIEKRLNKFVGTEMCRWEDKEEIYWHEIRERMRIERIGLTMDQVREINPPPNPAKTSDSRFEDYFVKYGAESWELDALDPSYMNDLIETNIVDHVDGRQMQQDRREMQKARRGIKDIANNLDSIMEDLNDD